MSKVEFPTRRGLIIGAAVVALHGRQQEAILQARYWKMDDWRDHADYKECERLIQALTKGQSVTTRHRDILDLMAHTCQVLRVPYDEWEATVPLKAAED